MSSNSYESYQIVYYNIMFIIIVNNILEELIVYNRVNKTIIFKFYD
jgi:hypothetical protein